MRKKAVFGNWKMHKLPEEARGLSRTLRDALEDVKSTELAVFPPALSLPVVAGELAGSNVGAGAQNIHYEKEGAFTGEISARMARAVGAKYVLIGHSERRHIFGESDEWVNLKCRAGLEAGLVPIVCVGETLEQRDKDETNEVVSTQVKKGLNGIDADSARSIILAYEPVWAIGTGKTATPEQAQEVHAMIRNLIDELYGEEYAGEKRILYGGSVKPGNTTELVSQADIDGALVGGASLKPDSFEAIVRAAEKS